MFASVRGTIYSPSSLGTDCALATRAIPRQAAARVPARAAFFKRTLRCGVGFMGCLAPVCWVGSAAEYECSALIDGPESSAPVGYNCLCSGAHQRCSQGPDCRGRWQCSGLTADPYE